MMRKLFAEFFGPFWLVLAVLGTAMRAAGVKDVGVGWLGVAGAACLAGLTSSHAVGGFAAGRYAGPVVIDSFGASHCLKIDFTPLGARRFFLMPMHELAGRMVVLTDVLGHDGLALRGQLGNTPDWPVRFKLAEQFVLSRIAERIASLS